MTVTFADRLADPDRYLPPAPQARSTMDERISMVARDASGSQPIDIQEGVEQINDYLASRGFVFDPWQVAAFITAVRTKPFVVLAGISGTGKTKLPRLIAEATGALCETVPVRPDWTDSSDLLGFERLNGIFQPGSLLRFAKRAQEAPDRQFFFVLDEMNIARVEYYLAEILSQMEEQLPAGEGRAASKPLMPHAPPTEDGEEWRGVRLPDNLCLVGSVNMDETTYGFSRKVLDRAFVIEFSTIDLSVIGEVAEEPAQPTLWSSADWRAVATSLAAHPDRGADEVGQMIETLTRVNDVLEQGQLQVGYRVRDEIVMFCLAARQCSDSFTTANAGTVDPLSRSR